jgi:parvulin-like peptidyl-prolyl isomerase
MTAPDLISSDGTATEEWSLARPDARRSLILCATGAILGLAIAGFGLFTAEGTRTASVPAEDAAVVNQIPILRSDFLQQLRALHDVDLSRATPAQKKQVLDDMIREELYVQRGVELGMANDDVDVRTALVAATEGQTALDATTAGATDEELRAYFNAHRGAYAGEGTIELADWLVPIGQESRASAIAAALRGGATPQSQSLVTSGKVDDGQEYYFAARIHLGPALFDAAVPLKDGEASAPFAVAGRTHILVMKHNRPPPPVVFEKVRDQVFGNFVRDKIARLEQGNARFLRKRADIKIAPDLQ